MCQAPYSAGVRVEDRHLVGAAGVVLGVPQVDVAAQQGRPGLMGTMARTAVVAGTATVVSGSVSQHSAQKAAEQQQAAAQQQAMVDQAAAQAAAQLQAQQPAAQPAAPPAAAPDDRMAKSENLAR